MVYKFRVEMTYDKKLNYIRHLNDLDKIWKIKTVWLPLSANPK